MCECCNDESGGKDVGVASIPGVPMSIMWCDNCLDRTRIIIPQSAADYFFIFGAEGNLDNLADWVKEYWTWADGRYMLITEYVKRITPEQVRKDLDDYEAAMMGKVRIE